MFVLFICLCLVLFIYLCLVLFICLCPRVARCWQVHLSQASVFLVDLRTPFLPSLFPAPASLLHWFNYTCNWPSFLTSRYIAFAKTANQYLLGRPPPLWRAEIFRRGRKNPDSLFPSCVPCCGCCECCGCCGCFVPCCKSGSWISTMPRFCLLGIYNPPIRGEHRV